MREVLPAHVTDDALLVLLVHHRHVDLQVRPDPEGLPARLAELVLQVRVVPTLEVPAQTLRLDDLAALHANALINRKRVFLNQTEKNVSHGTFSLSCVSLKCGFSSYLVGKSWLQTGQLTGRSSWNLKHGNLLLRTRKITQPEPEQPAKV